MDATNTNAVHLINGESFNFFIIVVVFIVYHLYHTIPWKKHIKEFSQKHQELFQKVLDLF